MRLFRVFALPACLSLGLTSAAHAGPMFMGLGDFDGGEYWSVAYGVSADGAVVVGEGSLSVTGDLAFRWTSDGGDQPPVLNADPMRFFAGSG